MRTFLVVSWSHLEQTVHAYAYGFHDFPKIIKREITSFLNTQYKYVCQISV
jgi:hypothetical protein